MDLAVTFTNVYKEYPFYQHVKAGFKSFLFDLPKSIASLKKTRFIALKGISFEVEKGEIFGIIGRNGSGKSTILGLMAGVMKPDSGSVMTNGRISSLLELGAGFHPDLSGVENIVLNGILSGNTKEEMLKKIEEIIEFSELGEFIYQPLRTYSSGMQARLGFAVAVHIDPEILLVDEALAVGDIDFKEKSLRKMKEFMESGVTTIIVSHDMPAIAELCDKVAWIDNGSLMEIGDPREVIRAYLRHLGQEIDFDEEEREEVTEVQSLPEIEEVLDDFVGTQEPVSEIAGFPVMDVIAEPSSKPVSWWDSPLVMHECEMLITGDPNIHFYEFLKRDFSVANLRKGLSLCRRLKGIEDNFARYHACESFDIIGDETEIKDIPAVFRNLEKNHYDLFLCVDLLNHVSSLEIFLRDVADALKEKGVVIALEYIGPACFQWSQKSVKTAEMILRAIGNHGSSEIMNSGAEERTAVNGDRVIPTIGRYFDINAICYFGGPFYDLILNRILPGLDQSNEKDAALIRTVIQCEQVLIREKILDNAYAMIIARKRPHRG